MNLKNKIIFVISILLFSFITLFFILNRTPFWDETHAFNIARLKIPEILYLTRLEGHYALWFLILKPFSSIKLYPYPMLIINWLFCLGAILFLWLKSPFNNLIKIFITFSVPFLLYFAPVARCYSIGIFFLFWICSCFKNRDKNPYKFSILLLICSNTSLMTAIICFYLWIIYLFKAIKKKHKELKPICGIFILNIILLFIQLVDFHKPYGTKQNFKNFYDGLFSFVLMPHSNVLLILIFKMCVFVMVYYLIYYLFKKSKYALFLYLSSFLTLTFIFSFIYYGSYWNYYFYYIYLITLFWIFYRQISSSKILNILITVILFFCMLQKVLHKDGRMQFIYNSNSRAIVDSIVKNLDLTNSKLYCLDWWSDISPASDIYFLKKGIKIYDISGFERTSFESNKKIFNYKTATLDFEKFYNNLDKSKNNYIITDGTLFNMKKTKSTKKYYLKPVFRDDNLQFAVLKLLKNNSL